MFRADAFRATHGSNMTLDAMSLKAEFEEFALSVDGLCSHISLRQDEDGPYIFALGVKGTHTLQLRKAGGDYFVQLWYGPDAETERVVGKPAFSAAVAAFDVAREWLQRDAI
jgi:hypothetical protein